MPMSDRGRSASRSRSPAGETRARRDSRDGGERGRGGEDKGTRSLIVRNVAYTVDKHELKDVFSKYGDIRDVYIPEDYYTRRPRGFAFVEFLNSDDAK